MYNILISTLHLPLANLAVIETNKELIWFQLQNINYSGVLNTCYVFLLSASESQHLFLGSYDLKNVDVSTHSEDSHRNAL